VTWRIMYWLGEYAWGVHIVSANQVLAWGIGLGSRYCLGQSGIGLGNILGESTVTRLIRCWLEECTLDNDTVENDTTDNDRKEKKCGKWLPECGAHEGPMGAIRCWLCRASLFMWKGPLYGGRGLLFCVFV
jgi:hypothetical protein